MSEETVLIYFQVLMCQSKETRMMGFLYVCVDSCPHAVGKGQGVQDTKYLSEGGRNLNLRTRGKPSVV